MRQLEECVPVSLGDRSYDVRIGHGALARREEVLPPGLKNVHRLFVVSDTHVAPLYLKSVREALEGEGRAVSQCVVPAGEGSKCVDRLAEIWKAAVEARLDRHSAFVALGGGVVGDLAGFAAASYLRGVPFVQIPTSLLAMVDSSVGGKTGINLPHGKNLVGAFHQPARVVADLEVLSTLPAREFSAGMAEVIKYGVIADADLFGYLERHVDRIRALDAEYLMPLVKRSCEIKAEMVRRDEREGGVRALLNFGHTLGHAIEKVRGYGDWLHGEAISAGMVYAARLSEKITGFPAKDSERLIALLRAYDLPVTWQDLEWDEVYTAMTADKKARDAVPRFVLAEAIGHADLPLEVSPEALQTVFSQKRG